MLRRKKRNRLTLRQYRRYRESQMLSISSFEKRQFLFYHLHSSSSVKRFQVIPIESPIIDIRGMIHFHDDVYDDFV